MKSCRNPTNTFLLRSFISQAEIALYAAGSDHFLHVNKSLESDKNCSDPVFEESMPTWFHNLTPETRRAPSDCETMWAWIHNLTPETRRAPSAGYIKTVH